MKKLIQHSTEKFFEENLYDSNTAEILATKLSEKIRDEIVNLKHRHPRYKFNVQVYLSEKKGQKVNIIAKGLWDPYVDNYSTFTLQRDFFNCSVIVWGIYHD